MKQTFALEASRAWWHRVGKEPTLRRVMIGVGGVLMGAIVGLEVSGYPMAAFLVGFIMLLYLPGWFFSLILFPYRADARETDVDRRSLDVIERITMSFLFSLILTSVIVYGMHLATDLPPLGYKLTPRNFFLVMGVALMALGVVAALRQRVISWMYAVLFGGIPAGVLFVNALVPSSARTWAIVAEVAILMVVAYTATRWRKVLRHRL